MILSEYLSLTNTNLAKVITSFADAVTLIADKIRTANADKSGDTNTFGDEQLKIDMLADHVIFTDLKKTGVVAVASSEEQPIEVALAEEGEFSVAFDPLDGSSLVDSNLAVGTIFGIWKSKTLLGQTGNDLVAAGYAIYGPRTTLILTLGAEPSKFTRQADGTWLRTRTKLRIEEGKMFAPGNLRCCTDNPQYRKLVDFWITEGYTLRYSGGMVPDVHQILMKEKGVFCYPGSKSAPAKLRLLYECAPLAKIVESAGGTSSDGTQSILTKKISSMDERTTICLGSKEEVKLFEKFCGNS